MIQTQNLTYSYPGSSVPAISDLSLTLEPGAVYGLLGANGTGKSTLLYLLCGLLKPTSGYVDYNGTYTFRRQPSVLADFFIVPEEIDIPAISLDEFVKINAPFYPEFSIEQLNDYLEKFRLTPDIHLGRLSMGQRKKAFIAFALACNTKVLLMDEPTNGLDIPGKAEFRRVLVSAVTDLRTIVVSTHQVRDLDQVLDHVVMIDRQGVILNTSLANVQRKLQFVFTTNTAGYPDALMTIPVIGGNIVIRRRGDNEPETAVNLEALFELAYTNPQNVAEL